MEGSRQKFSKRNNNLVASFVGVNHVLYYDYFYSSD